MATAGAEGEGVNLPGAGGWTAAVLAVLLLAVGVPVYILAHEDPSNAVASVAMIVQWFVVIVATLRLAHLMIFRPAPLHVVFWLYVYVFLGLAPLAQLAAGAVPVSNTASPNSSGSEPVAIDTSSALRTSVIVLVGVAAYELARLFVTRRAKASGDAELNRDRVRYVAFASLVISGWYMAVLGPATLLGPRLDLDRAVSLRFPDAMGPLVTAFATVPVWMSLLALLLLRKEERFRHLGTRMLIWALAIVGIIVVNPISSPRFIVGTLYGALAIALITHRRGHRSLRPILFAVGLALLVVFPYADVFRNSVSESVTAGRPGPIAQFQTKLDYDSYGAINNATLFTHARGYQTGRQALGAVFFFVPRSMWPTKPVATGILLSQQQGARFTNTSAPLWAEGFVDLGFPGVALFLGFWGIVSARLDLWWDRSAAGTLSVALLAVPLTALYQVIILRGSLAAVLGRLLAIALVVLVLRQVQGRTTTGQTGRLLTAPSPMPSRNGRVKSG